MEEGEFSEAREAQNRDRDDRDDCDGWTAAVTLASRQVNPTTIYGRAATPLNNDRLIRLVQYGKRL